MEKEKFLEELGANIKSIRERKGISQRTLALESDMEKSNLIRIEKGRTNPTSLTLLKISKALNVKIKELLDFDH